MLVTGNSPKCHPVSFVIMNLRNRRSGRGMQCWWLPVLHQHQNWLKGPWEKMTWKGSTCVTIVWNQSPIWVLLGPEKIIKGNGRPLHPLKRKYESSPMFCYKQFTFGGFTHVQTSSISTSAVWIIIFHFRVCYLLDNFFTHILHLLKISL